MSPLFRVWKGLFLPLALRRRRFKNEPEDEPTSLKETWPSFEINSSACALETTFDLNERASMILGIDGVSYEDSSPLSLLSTLRPIFKRVFGL